MEPFQLDPFQIAACASIDADRNVLVCAPTGSGKTVVAVHAIDRALHRGERSFYTTPIKALSNQKFSELCRRLGDERVGLLTGDTSIRSDADVVVMTTEVLRNMIYADSDQLARLGVVVLDEVHYLQDRYRGPVWEEVIIHAPERVRLVCLSATVSNAVELGEWLESVRGPTETVVETHRPVPLQVSVAATDTRRHSTVLVPAIVGGRPNPKGAELDDSGGRRDRSAARGRDRGDGKGGGRRGAPPRRFAVPKRTEVYEELADRDLLPAICFVFSRKGCDQAAAQLRGSTGHAHSPERSARVRELANARSATLSEADRDALGYDSFVDTLSRGVAAHHAGLVPPFKEIVEACFAEGLIDVVFATETLALGINMPARSVVIESLSKYSGDGHADLTPAQFTQMCGRAGRRGIDTEGDALVLWTPFHRFSQVAALASATSFPLVSAFRPTYNMAANLVDRVTQEQACDVLRLSFAQFQSDRVVVSSQARLRKLEREAAAARQDAECERGSITSYVRRQKRIDGRVDAGSGAGSRALHPGQVLRVRDGGGLIAVVSVANRSGGRIQVTVLDREGHTATVPAADISAETEPAGSLALPQGFRANESASRRRLAEALRLHERYGIAESGTAPGAAKRPKRQRGPSKDSVELRGVAGCPDLPKHLEAFAREDRLRRELGRERRAIARRGATLDRQLDAVVSVLTEVGYLDGWTLTPSGALLCRIFHESDLLIAHAILGGLFDGLDVPSLCGLLSVCIYEPRGGDPAPPPRFPSGDIRDRVKRLERMHRRINEVEAAHHVALTRAPDSSFFPVAYRWGAGASLAETVDASPTSMTAGDVVRQLRLIADLAHQVSVVHPHAPTAAVARAARAAIERGVVLATSTEPTDTTGNGLTDEGTADGD